MPRGLVVFVCLAALTPLFGSNVQLLSQLPHGANASAIELDASGNIYVAGSFAPGSVHDSADAFVAKLSPDGAKLSYFTTVGGFLPDGATALALASDGSAFVAGYTSSSDFPVTPGAFQPTYQGGGQNQGFLVKVNPAGAIVYSTFVTGPLFTQITGIALGSDGEVFLTGVGGPEYSFTSTQGLQGFVLKLDAALSKVLISIYGFGGGLIRLDRQGNIYLAGSAQVNVAPTGSGPALSLPPLPATAFQPTHDARFCLTLGSGPGGPGGAYSCRYQYVAKLNPTGAALWATYVTGTYGAIARGMAVDPAGNVIVAGTTYSDDYPVTAGAFQTAYSAGAPPFPEPAGSSYRPPPPAAGYVTKVNATGTGLIWSTYFGGSFSDEITGMAVSPTGDILIAGRAASSDLPALAATPAGCRPSANQPLGFVARLASNGATAGPAQLVMDAPDCAYLTCPTNPNFPGYQPAWPLAVRSDGTVVVAGTNGTLASVDFSATGRLACLTDPADNVQLHMVAPGQFLSLFGADLAPAAPFTPPGGVTASTSDFGVFFNGVPAPILYASAQQINVQVPFEIAGQTSVQMQVIDKQTPLPVSETRTLAVVERQPAIFLTPAAMAGPFPWYTQCGSTVVIGEAAIALNADGTLNDCTHPAPAGSVVTLFLDGLGQVTPALTTGAASQPPAVTLTPGVNFADPSLSPIPTTTTTVPGSLTALTAVHFRVPPVQDSLTPLAITPTLLGQTLRERLVLIWARPN